MIKEADLKKVASAIALMVGCALILSCGPAWAAEEAPAKAAEEPPAKAAETAVEEAEEVEPGDAPAPPKPVAPVVPKETKGLSVPEKYRAAKVLFDLHKYEKAAQLCQEILDEDAANVAAEMLMYKAKAAHYEKELEKQKLKAEVSRKRALLDVDEAGSVPVDERRLPRPLIEERVINIKEDLPEEKIELIQEKLNQRISVNLIDADLSYILNLLFKSCGINIIADQQALASYTLTIHVQDFPLSEILKYIARQFDGISYTLTPEAVWITTPQKPLFETKAVYLRKGLVDVMQPAESAGSDLEMLLARLPELIEWPAGSTWYVDRKENILYIKSTPEALSKAMQLVDTLDVTPTQILIEARFVEIGADDLDDLGIEWNFTSPYVITEKGGEPATQVQPGSGTSFGTPAIGGPEFPGGLGMQYVGVLTDPQFRLVLHMLNEKTDTNTLSAPKLIALNNYTATIEIRKNVVYVESFEIDYPDSTTTTSGDGTTVVESSSPTITPKIAEEMEGILLRITPSIGSDKETVTLTIQPDITERVAEEKFDYTFPGTEDEGTQVKQFVRPVMSTRTLLTKMAIRDGSTIVIGGLMKDMETTTVKRVPGLSRIPLLGRLFRRDEKTVEKRNLMIFVTAHVLDPTGKTYLRRKPTAEENEARSTRASDRKGDSGVEVVEERNRDRRDRDGR